jgi:ribosomal protein S18 acetylase RimI-like enzyme
MPVSSIPSWRKGKSQRPPNSIDVQLRIGGAHVGNYGHMTAPEAYGRGMARMMCAHSLSEAAAHGFRAIQFNFAITSNERAVRLWQSMGFEIVGTLPSVFAHSTRGLVDAFAIYRKL